jgi:hypothetical protein
MKPNGWNNRLCLVLRDFGALYCRGSNGNGPCNPKLLSETARNPKEKMQLQKLLLQEPAEASVILS